MKNFVQEGEVVSVLAPATVVAGQGVLVGSIFGVAITDAASGAPVNIGLRGIYALPKVSAEVWTAGQILYWNGTAVTNVASTNKIIGATPLAVAGGVTTANVLLNQGVVN
jgi:predicted RecA/RadA family phage recombinase